jgi:Glutamine amidotransferases class-II
MCMAIYKPTGKQIKRKYLKNAFNANPHGCGIAWVENGEINILKGMWTFDKFWAEYQAREKHPMLIHFRFATHGEKNETNCHPFMLNGGQFAMIHNGVLPIAQTIEHLSDTGNFCELVLNPLLKTVQPDNPALRYLIEQTIGKNNKIAVIDVSGNATIYNEGAGHWHKGVWYSNDGYKASLWCDDDCDAWNYHYSTRRWHNSAWDETDTDSPFADVEDDIQTAMSQLSMTREQAIAFIGTQSAM